MMNYKNYVANVTFDDEAEVFHGEVINTKDVITFQGSSVKELKKEFELSVNDYLEFCKERGEEPEKPYSGRFNLRVSPELHRQASMTASEYGMSLNAWICDVLKHAIEMHEQH